MEEEAGEERSDDAKSSSGGGQGTAGSVAQSDPDHYESTLSRAVNAEAPRRNSQVPGLTITLAGTSKRYGRAKRGLWALHGIDLTIEPGVFGLLGRNGAGKTTLLQILATLLDATAGTIRIGPYTVPRDRWAVRSSLGYLPQEQGFYPTLTAEETLRYLATLQGLESLDDAVARALDAVNLSDRARSRVGELSGGMRRRLGLAQALLGDPPIVIVDEPTAGLDPVEQQRFRTLLGTLGAQGDRTVVLSTHVVADVATVARRLAVLEEGRLVFEGNVRELAARARGRTWQWRTTIEGIEAARRSGHLIITAVTPVETAAAGAPLLDVQGVGERPAADAVPREPTLEDGYFAVVGRTDEREVIQGAGGAASGQRRLRFRR